MKIDDSSGDSVFSGLALAMIAFVAGYWFAVSMEGAADLRKKAIDSGCAYYDAKTAKFTWRKLQ